MIDSHIEASLCGDVVARNLTGGGGWFGMTHITAMVLNWIKAYFISLNEMKKK